MVEDLDCPVCGNVWRGAPCASVTCPNCGAEQQKVEMEWELLGLPQLGLHEDAETIDSYVQKRRGER